MAAPAAAMAPAPQAAAQAAVPAPEPTSWAPTAKVAVGGLAGAVTIITLEILGHYHVAVSAEFGGAITTIVTFVIQYITPERK